MRADDLPPRVRYTIVRGPRAQRAARFGTADYEALYCRWLRDGDSALDRADGEGFLKAVDSRRGELISRGMRQSRVVVDPGKQRRERPTG
jgi:hypothetical protein